MKKYKVASFAVGSSAGTAVQMPTLTNAMVVDDPSAGMFNISNEMLKDMQEETFRKLMQTSIFADGSVERTLTQTVGSATVSFKVRTYNG